MAIEAIVRQKDREITAASIANAKMLGTTMLILNYVMQRKFPSLLSLLCHEWPFLVEAWVISNNFMEIPYIIIDFYISRKRRQPIFQCSYKQ
jgi:hypothetical protein